MSRNPKYCPHNITDIDLDTNEEYCMECGVVVNKDEEPLDES
jgi:nitrate reductase cytochrome c-type subunit